MKKAEKKVEPPKEPTPTPEQMADNAKKLMEE
jgi:hypothetical protein